MGSLTPGARLALGRYWSEIIGSASQHLKTADMFAAIRQRAGQLGLPSVGVGAQDIQRLRGVAGRMIESARQLGKATNDQAVTSRMIAEPPWSRSPQEMATFPTYHVTFVNEIQRLDGSIVIKNHTYIIDGLLPASVGELRLAVEQEAQRLAAMGGPPDSDTPKGVSLSQSNLMILAV